MNKFLPLLFLAGLLSGCVYFNTVYNAKTAYDSGVESYHQEERQGRDISNQTKDQFRRAVEKGKKILTEYSDSKYVDDAYLLIGKSYFYLDQAGLARNYLSDLISNYPNSPYREEARLYLGKAYLPLEENPLARHEFEYLINNSKNHSLRAQAYMALADLEKSDGTSSAMLDNVQSAIEIADDNEVKADAAWRTGQWALEHKEFGEAEKFFQEAARFTRKPDYDRRIQVQLVRIWRLQERYELANDKIQAMLAEEEYSDQYAELEIQRGLVYEARDDTSKAADTYRYVVSEYPRTSAAAAGYYYLAELAYERMDFDEAKKNYDKVSVAFSKSEYTDDTSKKIGIIGNLQKYRNSKNSLRQALIDAYTTEHMPEPDSVETAANTDTADSTQELSAKEQMKQALLENEQAEEDTTSEQQYTFQEVYPWVLEQDSLDTRNEYAQAMYNLAELFILDIKRFERGLTLTDSVLTLATSDELKAQSRLLQAHTYEAFLDNPSKAAKIIEEVRGKYPESEALHLYDTRDQLTQKKEEPSTPSPEYIALAKKYSRADSLLADDQVTKAQDIFRQIYRDYTNSEFGPKSLYALGWMYENKLMQIDSAIAKYEEFQARYPDHKITSSASSRLQDLRSIKSALTAKPEDQDTAAQSMAPAEPDTSTQAFEQPVEDDPPETDFPTP